LFFFFFFRSFIAAPSTSPGVIAQGLHSLDQHHWPTPPLAAHNDNRGYRKRHASLGRLCSRLTGNSKPRNPRYAQFAELGGSKTGVRCPNHSVCSLWAKTGTLPRLRRHHFNSARYGRGDRRKRPRSHRSGRDRSLNCTSVRLRTDWYLLLIPIEANYTAHATDPTNDKRFMIKHH